MNSLGFIEIRVFVVNILTFMLSFTDIEIILKIILLLLSIVYTAAKINEIRVDRKAKRDENKHKEV